MSLLKHIYLLLTLVLTSCFMGADTYEKTINEYFWIYRDDSPSASVCLGTIDYGQYRLGDNYLCSVKKVGWNKSFLIAQTESNQFMIQDLKFLKARPSSDFGQYKYGPLSRQQFSRLRDSLRVEKDLDFQITY